MKLSKRQYFFWKALQERLRKKYPSPVKNTRVMIQDWLNKKPYNGTTAWNAEREMVTIYIRRAAPFDVKIDTLIHEWAHVISQTEDHGPKWSRSYGRCYRVFEKLVGEHQK